MRSTIAFGGLVLEGKLVEFQNRYKGIRVSNQSLFPNFSLNYFVGIRITIVIKPEV